MTLHINEATTIIIDDGEILVVEQGAQIEIWSSDGESLYGFLPAGTPVETIKAAFRLYQSGFEAGIEYGRSQMKSDLRRLLF